MSHEPFASLIFTRPTFPGGIYAGFLQTVALCDFYSNSFFSRSFTRQRAVRRELGFHQRYRADPTGAVIPNASVEIHNPVSGYDRITTTDSKGIFSFPNIPFNPYHMTAKAEGFAQIAQDVDVRSVVSVTSKSAFKFPARPPLSRSRPTEATLSRTIPPSTPTSTKPCSTSFPWKALHRP